jgi:hypothetical protein
MALWGSADSKTATGTVSITSPAGAVTFSSSQTLRIGDVIRVSGEDYVVVIIPSTQPATTGYTARAGVQGATMTARTTQAFTLSEKPIFVAVSESADTVGNSGDDTKVYGVDTVEIGIANAAGSSRAGVQHAGWVRRVAGTGGRAGRIQYETLVASGSITGDQGDDTQFPDA